MKNEWGPAPVPCLVVPAKRPACRVGMSSKRALLSIRGWPLSYDFHCHLASLNSLCRGREEPEEASRGMPDSRGAACLRPAWLLRGIFCPGLHSRGLSLQVAAPCCTLAAAAPPKSSRKPKRGRQHARAYENPNGDAPIVAAFSVQG